MSDRILSTQSSDVARIATQMPLLPTSADLLKALHESWRAGYNAGRAHGFVEGQRNMSDIHETVMRAMG
jgi:hypothetical protein